MSTTSAFDIQNYTRLLPSRIDESVVASGFISCVTTLIRTRNFYFACSIGAFAALAALVDGLGRPFIEHELGRQFDDKFLDVESFYLRVITIYSLSCLIGPTFGVSASLIGAVVLAALSPLANLMVGYTRIFGSSVRHSNGYVVVG